MKKILTTSAAVITMLSLQGCFGVTIIDTGKRGIETRFGQVVGEPLAEGIHFYNPFTSDIVEIDTRLQKWEFEAETYTRDIQQAKLKVVINYGVDRAKVGQVYRDVGVDWANKLIPQTAEGTLKSVIGKWDAVDLIDNRAKAQQDIQDTIASILLTKGIVVSRVEIQNIDYTSEFEKVVEEKVAAIQEAEKQKNITTSIRERANQTIISAQADAQAMKIKSDALSQNANLVQYEAVQKWDGKLPEYMLGNSVPFINIKN